MQAGQDSDGRMGGFEEMCTVIMLWFFLVGKSGESFHTYTRFIRWGVSTVYQEYSYSLLGGNVYREEEVCISVIVTRVSGVLCRVQ